MKTLLDLQKKAQDIRKTHQNNIDNALEAGMKQIFTATENTLNKKAQNLSENIDQTKLTIQQQQAESEQQILEQIQEQTETIIQQYQVSTQTILNHQNQLLTELLKKQDIQIQELQANLAKQSNLMSEIGKQTNFKNILSKSILGLISIACILITINIYLSYKINDLTKTGHELEAKNKHYKIGKCGSDENYATLADQSN